MDRLLKNSEQITDIITEYYLLHHKELHHEFFRKTNNFY